MKVRPNSLTRPQKWVVVVSLMLLALGACNLGRMGLALYYNAHRPPTLSLTVSLPYLAGMGAFWGAAFLLCGVGLLSFQPWGQRFAPAAATMYEVHVWINHFLFDANDYAYQTRPRDMALTLLLLAFVWGGLSWPGVRKVFEQ